MLSTEAAEAARAAWRLLSSEQFTKLQERCPASRDPAVLDGYLHFLALKMGAHDYYDCLLSPPSSQIELVWRDHLLDTRHYSETCARLGVPASVRVLNYNPDPVSKADDRKEYTRLFYAKAFGAPSSGMWATPTASSTTASEAEPDPPLSAPPPPALPLPAPKRQRVADCAQSPASAPTLKVGDATPAASADTLNLKLQALEGGHIIFKLKRTTSLEKMMTAYCKRMNVLREKSRFLFDGTRLRSNDTPESLEMEDGDVVEVFMEQIG